MDRPAGTQIGRTVFDYPDDAPVIVTRRAFAAPREMVWRAHVEAGLLRRWWGPREVEITRCEADPRPGGAWAIEHELPDGRTVRFHGRYDRIDPPSRLEETFACEDYPPALLVQTFDQLDDLTLLTETMTLPLIAVRNGMRGSGMEAGAQETHDRLDELLAALGRS